MVVVLVGFVLIRFKNEMVFEPHIFVNQLFGFAISTLSLFISFMLGQVYWEQRERNRKKAIFTKSMLDLLQKWTTITRGIHSDFQHPVEIKDYNEIGEKLDSLEKKIEDL